MNIRNRSVYGIITFVIYSVDTLHCAWGSVVEKRIPAHCRPSWFKGMIYVRLTRWLAACLTGFSLLRIGICIISSCSWTEMGRTYVTSREEEKEEALRLFSTRCSRRMMTRVWKVQILSCVLCRNVTHQFLLHLRQGKWPRLEFIINTIITTERALKITIYSTLTKWKVFRRAFIFLQASLRPP